MRIEEKDTFDELFRTKLEGFEVDTEPGDWEAIANRLPERGSVSLGRTLRYWAAAAVVSLLMAVGGVYLMKDAPQSLPLANELKEQETLLPNENKVFSEEPKRPVTQVENTEHRMNVAALRSSSKPTYAQAVTPAVAVATVESEPEPAPVTVEAVAPQSDVAAVASEAQSVAPQTKTLLAQATPTPTPKEKRARKWGFGMGGGGLSVGSASSTVPQYMMKSSLLTADRLSAMNSPFFNSELPKTDVNHNIPISVGLGVSYHLNKRFSLQSGLNYSYLASDWVTNGEYHGEVKQKLHFIGIPLSLVYNIAEWNRFQFYAGTGAMAELNVSGRQQSKFFLNNEEISKVTEEVRMKPLLWSVNARAGVSYPLIRFVSAFAEAGAAYYFDNGSSLETIHTEKPFNVNFQFGFRFGL